MSFIILPLGYITFLIPFFDHLYHKVTIPFEWIISSQSRVSLFQVDYAFYSPIWTIIYYVFLVSMVLSLNSKYKQKLIASFICFLIIQNNVYRLSPKTSISIIDIYGDSILIKDQFNQCTILLDTGVNDPYNSVIKYIKSKQIEEEL